MKIAAIDVTPTVLPFPADFDTSRGSEAPRRGRRGPGKERDGTGGRPIESIAGRKA